jgi:hypothetical protein
MAVYEIPERCGCLCDTWEHDLDTCSEHAEVYQIFGVSHAFLVPLCSPCQRAIASRRRNFTVVKPRVISARAAPSA